MVTIRDSRPKITASTSAPSEVTVQPTSEIGPKAASEAGRRKMPEPIMLPTTSAVQATSPSPPVAATLAPAPSPQFAGAVAGAGAAAGASELIAARLSAAATMIARITSSGQRKRSQRL